jgi:flagellar protein FlaG
VQQAVAQPLLNPQAAVTQAPTAATVQTRNPHHGEGNIRQQGATGQQASTETQPTGQELTETVDYLNRFLKRFDTALQFDVDKRYGEMVVRIVDRQNQEVIRQIPSEETLAFAKFFKDLEAHGSALPESPNASAATEGLHLKLEGLLLDTRV